MPKNDIQKQGRILMLPVDCIEPSPYQARTAFDEPEIAALAVSILQNGLLQPISVRRVGIRKYQLVAGERRLRACRLAKLEKVPAILADYDDSESAALGLLENLQRSQLDPFDTARGIKEVIRLWGCTQAEAARRLGLSQPALANKLRLLTLTAEQQQLCTANHLSERHARAALRLPESALSRMHIGSVLFANKPGDGSAREQAASCQRVLGGCANICYDFATKRYRSNCVNWGMLPFTLADGAPFDAVPGDFIFVPAVREKVARGDQEFPAVLVHAGQTQALTLYLKNTNAEERELLLTGCLMNHYAAQNRR